MQEENTRNFYVSKLTIDEEINVIAEGLYTVEDGIEFSHYKKRLINLVSQVEEEAKKEIVICAAVVAEDGYVARGHRHVHCMATLRDMKKKYPHLKDGTEQGFITSKNRYVTRKEGYALQIEAGIPSADPGGYRGGELYSEDLY